MIGYVTLGTNDLPRATAFYDALLGDLGAKRMMESDNGVYWIVAPDKPVIGVTKPYDGKQATVGNGMMIALLVDSNEKVDAIYHKALALGGTDEGAPGERGMPGFYAAYFRDLDGNKLNCYCFKSA
jgi:catechol 2,3-dioxygenase-like lactoylglutathione lyase family enzyme